MSCFVRIISVLFELFICLDIDKYISEGEGIVCLTIFISLPHRQPHAIFRGFISVSGSWMLFRKEHMMLEDGPT